MSVENMGAEKIKRKKYISYLIYPVIFFFDSLLLAKAICAEVYGEGCRRKFYGRILSGNQSS